MNTRRGKNTAAHAGTFLAPLAHRFETRQQMADALGISRVMLSRILHGHQGIGLSTALKLEKLGLGDAREWMIRDIDWRLAEARNTGHENQ